MAQFDSVSLELLLTAKDDASDNLKTLQGVVESLGKSIKDIAGIKDPFAQLQADADTFSGSIDSINKGMATLAETFKKGLGSSNPFDTATTDAKGLADNINSAKKAYTELSDALKGAAVSDDPYHEVESGAKTLKTDIDGAKTALSELRDSIDKFSVKDPFRPADGDANTLAGDFNSARTALKDLGTAISSFTIKDNPLSSITTDVSNLNTELRTAIKYMQELGSSSVPSGGGSRTSGTGMVKGSRTGGASTSAIDQFVGLDTSKMTPQEKAAYAAAAYGGESAIADFMKKNYPGAISSEPSVPTSPVPKTPGGGTSSHGTGDLMGMAMNGMMAFYGLQSLVNGASNMMNIQQMMQVMGQSHGYYGQDAVNQAAQNYLMLTAGGMSVQQLGGLTGNLQHLFQPVGNNVNPDIARLASLGFTKDQLVTSPWMTLQNIQGDYARLMSQGRSSDAAELLGMTGTGSMGNAFNNWANLKQSASGINLGMDSSQLAQAAKLDSSVNMDMSKLSLEFDQLAQSVMPVVDSFAKLATALGPLVTAITKYGDFSSKHPNLSFATGNPFPLIEQSIGAVANLLTPNQASQTSYLKGQSGNLTKAQYQSDLSAINKGQSPIAMRLNVFTQEMENWAAGLWPAVSKDWKTFESSLGKSIGGMWNNMTSNWKTFEANFGKSFGALWGDETRDWSKFKSDFGKSIGLLWSDVESGNWTKFESDFGKSISSLWSDTSSAWDSFKADLSKWVSGLGANLGLDMQAAGVAVDQTLNQVPGIGKYVEPSSAVTAAETSLAQNEFKTWTQQRLPSNLPQGKSAHVTVDHTGKLEINFTNAAGISAADKKTIQQIANEVKSQIWNSYKVAYNADISF